MSRVSCRYVGPEDSERGSTALIVVLLTVAMFAMAGLVIDGGTALATRGRAADVAQQAARAGADATTPGSLRGNSPGDLRIDSLVATRAGQDVLTSVGAQGTVHVSAYSVSVTATIVEPTVILSAFGVGELTGTGTATATLLHGTTTGSTG